MEDPGLVQFNTEGVYTVTFTVTDSLGLPDPTPATRTVTVLGNSGGGVIPQDTWSLVYTDSQETVAEDGAAINAFDGDPSTLWVTQWYPSSSPMPHEIQINLGGSFNIGGFRYLPRQDDSINGTISQYEFYVSSDGVDWGSPVATGTFAADITEKEVLFSTTTGQYIRLRALSEINGNPWTAIAELNIEALADIYVGFGDSITAGSHDDIDSDGKGYEPILATLLSDEIGYPNFVENEGVSGNLSIDGVNRIASVLSAHPSALYYLILFGTNDAMELPAIPSGLGLHSGNPNYSGTFKENMQTIITMIKTAGKIPYLAKIPIAFAPYTSLNTFIQEYNQVVDELVSENSIGVIPPDFYSFFSNNPGQISSDGLHPNGIGYQSMAQLWSDALLGLTP